MINASPGPADPIERCQFPLGRQSVHPPLHPSRYRKHINCTGTTSDDDDGPRNWVPENGEGRDTLTRWSMLLTRLSGEEPLRDERGAMTGVASISEECDSEPFLRRRMAVSPSQAGCYLV